MGTIKIKEAINKTVEEGVEKIKEILAPKKEETATPSQSEFAGIMPKNAAAVSSEINENGYLCKLNNRTEKEIISCIPVNFYDKKENVWKAIDNTFKENGDVFETVCGAIKTAITKADKGKRIQLEKDGKTISWEFLGKQRKAGEQRIEKKPVLEILHKLGEAAKKIATGVVYRDIEENTDLEYRLSGNNVKENIIVKERAEEYRYDFDLRTNGLKLKLSADNRSLEFYSEAGSKQEKCEFRIPSPFMYDGAMERSDEVYYELDKKADGRFTFTVVASAEWINDESRTFPVTIDPQIVTVSESLMEVIVERSRFIADGAGTSSGGASGYSGSGSGMNSGYRIYTRESWERDYASELKVSDMYPNGYRTRIVIKGENILNRKDIIKAKLRLTPIGNFSGTFTVNETSRYYDSAEGDLELDITQALKYGGGRAVLILEVPMTDFDKIYGYKVNTFCGSFSNTEYPPVLEIERFAEEKTEPCHKEVELVPHTEGRLNVRTGEFTAAFAAASGDGLTIDFPVSQVYKKSGENNYCGQNVRLNLHEKLEKNTDSTLEADYVYTDAQGDKHGFKTRYCYIDAQNNKIEVPKSDVTVQTDGGLKDSSGHEVIKEEILSGGWKATTKLEGVKNAEFYEDRSDEIKQLEERKDSYFGALKDFAIVNKETGEIINSLKGVIGGLDKLAVKQYEDYKNDIDENLLLTQSEAISLRSLLLQKDDCEQQDSAYWAQIYSCSDQINSLRVNKESIGFSIDDLQKEKDNYLLRYVNASAADTSYWDLRMCNHNKQISNINDQLIQLRNQSNRISNKLMPQNKLQLKLVQDQLDALTTKSEDNKEQLETYFKEYINAYEKLEEHRKVLPVHYLTNGQIVKGYNKNGDLSVIFDHYENTLIVERDDRNRITALTDNKGKAIKFNYSEYGNWLTEITDVRGRRTKYHYENGHLKEIIYAGGDCLSFDYGIRDDLERVESSDKKRVELNYYGIRLSEIKYVGLASEIANGSYTNDYIEIGNYTLSYDFDLHAVTIYESEKKLKEKYVFNGDDNIAEYYKEEGGVITAAEKYTYGAYQYGRFESKTAETAKTETLNKTALASFVFEAGEKTTVYYDGVENATKKVESGKQISENTFAATTTLYEYDGDRRCVKETAVTKLSGGATNEYTAITTYAYNANGAVVRKESWVDGEEFTSGKTIEETIYDEHGNDVKSFSYNSLDTSSKFYKEKEYSEDRKVTAEKDETGATSVEYEYIEGADVVRSEKRANGSTFAYGHDSGDTVTAITQSTAEGEENSTQTHYTLGEVTKLVSGNTEVEYAYDGKRRKKAIKLNGAENYICYAYGTDDRTVTETNAKGEKITTVTDKQGNVVSVKYNDAEQFTNTYENGRLKTTSDKVTNETSDYTYDTLGNVTAFTRGEYTEANTYDAYGNVTEYNQNGRIYAYAYKNNAARDLKSVTVEGITITPEKDILGRNKGKEISVGESKLAGEYLYYRKVGDHATNMPSAVYFGQKKGNDFAIRDNVKYEYDKSGNICKIYENGALSVRYEYDSIDRLVREDNKKLGFTVLFAYDNCGNIISKRQTAFTLKTKVEECEFEETLYSYDKDKLLSFGTEMCEYDEIGNPTLYRGKAATWEKGRQLKSYNGVEFNYDGSGRRVSKNGITFTYDSDGKLIASSNGLEYLYDNAGVFGIKYNGETYFYRKDAQGNIVALLDTLGSVVVKYIYDAWGNHAVLDGAGNDISENSAHIGNLNPFRYRGYFYDTETELYFLKTRYYDPEVGRFITIDGIEYLDPESINGLNLYAYCGDNPVMRTDETGTMPNWLKWLIGGIVIVGLIIATVATGGAAGGVAGFILAGALKGAIVGAVSGALIGGTIGGITSVINGGSFWKGFADGAADGFMGGAIIGGVTGALSNGFKVIQAAKSWVSTGGKTGYQQMVKHYSKHVIDEGQKAIAKNIVNYTKQASQFFVNNNSAGHLLREGVIKISGAPGGIFNVNGLIRSFWYI